MEITVTIPDKQWQDFKDVAKNAVEASWNGKYEDFAMYIMAVNVESYIKAQQRKQEKEFQKALKRENERIKQEQS